MNETKTEITEVKALFTTENLIKVIVLAAMMWAMLNKIDARLEGMDHRLNRMESLIDNHLTIKP